MPNEDKKCSFCGKDIQPDDFVNSFGECIDCVNDQIYREYKED